SPRHMRGLCVSSWIGGATPPRAAVAPPTRLAPEHGLWQARKGHGRATAPRWRAAGPCELRARNRPATPWTGRMTRVPASTDAWRRRRGWDRCAPAPPGVRTQKNPGPLRRIAEGSGGRCRDRRRLLADHLHLGGALRPVTGDERQRVGSGLGIGRVQPNSPAALVFTLLDGARLLVLGRHRGPRNVLRRGLFDAALPGVDALDGAHGLR